MISENNCFFELCKLLETDRTRGMASRYFNQEQSVTYITCQQEIDNALASLQNMVIDPDFIVHVQKDGFKMKNIDKDLMEHRKDLTERDCAIIFAGIFFSINVHQSY